MTIGKKIALVVGFVVILTIPIVYALFHGYFDQGRFEVIHAEPSSIGKVAMIARRTDDQALGGHEYFVVIGDHLYSPRELRHAMYYGGVVFSTNMDCLATRWETANQLVVACQNGSIAMGSINAELHHFQGIAISYKNISPLTEK